jgi:hypothetical protein
MSDSKHKSRFEQNKYLDSFLGVEMPGIGIADGILDKGDRPKHLEVIVEINTDKIVCRHGGDFSLELRLGSGSGRSSSGSSGRVGA